VVRRGETLGGIARRYKTTVPRLQALNRLQGTRVIAGQTLRVRGTATPAKATVGKAPVKKASAKKSSPKKAPAKKAPVKKTPAKTAR